MGKKYWICVFIIGLLLFTGCVEQQAVDSVDLDLPEESNDLGQTIGDLAEIFAQGAQPVQGYGLVGELKGTGSIECPVEVRNYLKQYMLQQLPAGILDPDKFIDSKNTAVVSLYGIMPGLPSKGDQFDIFVTPLSGTQTTSLQDGVLYGANMKKAGTFGLTIKDVAKAEGPLFFDTTTEQPNFLAGYILNGGFVLDEYNLTISLKEPDYRAAAKIRNKINERFGKDIAEAPSPGLLNVDIPKEYNRQKFRFFALLRSVYIDENRALMKERIQNNITQLVSAENKFKYEVALEAIGTPAIKKLQLLLNSSQASVRFSAARCLLNIGDDAGLEYLRKTAFDPQSKFRIAALEAITLRARYNDAVSVARRLLRDEHLQMRLAAYENLRELNDITIKQAVVSNTFYLEHIPSSSPSMVFASRQGDPRIALFGKHIRLKEDIFVESDDGTITLNAVAGTEHVNIIRRHSNRPDVLIRMKSSFDLSDIIRILCEEPIEKDGQMVAGLGVRYYEMISLLMKMAQKEAFDAEFYTGPLPGQGLIIKPERSHDR